jgi:hypothetical protein
VLGSGSPRYAEAHDREQCPAWFLALMLGFQIY